MADHVETDRRYRVAMTSASAHLRDTLWREHPRIITHLQRKQHNRSK